MITISETEFYRLANFVKMNFGINLLNKKSFIEGRLSNQLYEMGFDNFNDYMDFIFSDSTGTTITGMIDKLTTNHTYFMREPNHFDFYERVVLPELVAKSKEHDLRVWSAGCSTGQEPYSIAMINSDFFGNVRNHWDTKILATDLSETALQKAKQGLYTQEEVADVDALFFLKYFIKEKDGMVRVSNAIRNEVLFRKFNLLEDVFPFRRKVHVIFCRNVMIYFDNATRQQLIQKFYDATEPGGYLFIGHSETINKNTTNYKYIKPSIYRKE